MTSVHLKPCLVPRLVEVNHVIGKLSDGSCWRIPYLCLSLLLSLLHHDCSHLCPTWRQFAPAFANADCYQFQLGQITLGVLNDNLCIYSKDFLDIFCTMKPNNNGSFDHFCSLALMQFWMRPIRGSGVHVLSCLHVFLYRQTSSRSGLKL